MPQGPHYPLIQRTLPAWLRDTSWPKAQALSRTPLHRLPDFIRADPLLHAPLKRANAQAWTTQNSVDQRLENLQDLYAFARPLLTQAIKERFALHVDVGATYLFLISTTGAVLNASASRTLSLLDAALHNFASNEYFTDDSSYITRPDARGHFMIEPFKQRMGIEQFVRLCRELNLGARYQTHLQHYLLPANTAAKAALQAEVIASQQAALDRAAHLALLQGEIDSATFALLQRTLRGERGVMQFYQLRMRDTLLTGILLLAAELEKATAPVRIVAYIPHDPHGALQHYADSHALMNALTTRLRDDDYRRFFSQFVDQSQRGHFFSETPPRPAFGAQRIDGELWPRLYQRSLNKILNDARELAVPTAQADSRARWAWWDNFKRIADSIFNVALLVITPFVPLLGELTMAYTAYQLLDEVVEGVVDLAEGHALDAAQHLIEVVSDVVQLGLFSVGGQLAQSAFVNLLKPVQVQGRTRLWNPDPRPYRQTGVTLPADSSADELGLHAHQGQMLLPVDEHLYAVAHDPASGAHRIQHPTRAEAYAPPLLLNTSPRAWNDRRLLSSVGAFSEAQAQQILAISGVDYGMLRAAKTEHTTPPLLDHSSKRFELNQQARQLPQRLRAGEPVDDDTYWSPHIARELPGWPAATAIDVYESADLSGECVRFGETEATRVLKISSQALNEGKLPERLVGFLGESRLRGLLGDTAEGDPVDALRNRLADNLEQRQKPLFDYFYRNSEDRHSALVLQVRKDFPELPNTLAQQVIDHARPAELASLAQQQRLPLRLRNLARELHMQARGAHGLEGFFDPALIGADTEQMTLNILRTYSDALLDTRLEIREHSATGTLRAQVGAADARRVGVLVRPGGDLFEAILQALPPDRRDALGFAAGDGQRFKAWVLAKLVAPEQRRTLLDHPGIGATPTRDAQVLTQKPMQRLQHWSSQLFPATLEERVKALYPYAAQAEIEAYLPRLEDPDHLQRFEAREIEKTELQTELSNWINLPAPGEDPVLNTRRLDLSQALIRCWEHNLNPGPRGIGLSLNGVTLQGLLGNLRLKADFDHVLHLDLIDTGLLDTDTTFLENFPRLCNLNLAGNALTRLPQPVTRMSGLWELILDNNPMQWDAPGLSQFKHLPWLRRLSLNGNRLLTLAPDIAGMPFLRELSLRSTGISAWPEGLFVRQRPTHFALDLQNTAIDHVPQFLPWQAEAELVARTRLDRNRLTVDAERNVVSYRIAAGLDPQRSYPPKGDASFWLTYEKPENQPWLSQLWDEVEQEHGSQGFFEVIKSLEQPERFEDAGDLLRYQLGRRNLSSKVWHLLLGMQADEALRSRLFLLASNPVTCADAGMHVFNAMGVEFELSDILNTLSGAEQQRQLVRLAKGKARLERLNQVAQADIRQRVTPLEQGGQGLRFTTQMVDGAPGTVDEVEVYLAYQTALKQRLGLPWVSEHMTYRETAEVDAARIEAAYDSVIALEAGDGLVDGMLAQGFWDSYLRTRHAEAFQASLERAGELLEPLDDLMFAQKAWAAERTDVLKVRLLSLADALNVPHTEVLTGEQMTLPTYERILAGGFSASQVSEQDLARRLTREALLPLGD